MKIQHIIKTSGFFTFPRSGGEATHSVSALGVPPGDYDAGPDENTTYH